MRRGWAVPVAALAVVAFAGSASASPVRAGQAVPTLASAVPVAPAATPKRASRKAEGASQVAAAGILLPLVIGVGIAGVVAAASTGGSDSNG